MEKVQIPLKTLDELNFFLSNAPKNWKPGEVIRRFQLYEHDYVSCVFWENQHYITGTDIVKALTFRFKVQGHEIKNVKKFEEGIFSDLRNLKPGIDSSLEEPKSPFLELLYKNKCIRTQKKQKVFFWYSVPYDRLYQDVLKRDKKRELNGKKSNIVIDKSKSPVVKREKTKSIDSSPTDINIFKGEIEINNNMQNSNIIYTKWVDETQKLSNSNNNNNKNNNDNANANAEFNDVKIKKEEDPNIKKEDAGQQLKKVKKGRKYIITKYFAKGPINSSNSSLKFVCDKKDCNKKFKKLEELVKHKKFVHGADKIGYNYSKDFMYVEKNLSFDKSDKNQLLSPSSNNTSANTSYIFSSPIELEDENNNWSIIISPDNSMSSSDESMIIDPNNFSLNDFSLGNISSLSLLNVNNQNSNGKTGKPNNHRLSVSSNATLSNNNNSNILSTATSPNNDYADTSMNTTFLSNQTFSNNSSFIIQSSDNQDIVLTNEDQFRKFISQLIKTEEMNYSEQNNNLSPLTPTTTNQSCGEAVVTQSQYVPCEVTNVTTASTMQQPVSQCVSVNNNNIPNVNDVTIPTAHFMAIDSPLQQDGTTSYLQNVPMQTQGQTQYITTDQYTNTAATVQYVPSIVDTATTTSGGNYISYELSSIINQVTNPPVNVYVTTKANPDAMNYVSSPTQMEYQRMNQPQPQPHTPTFSNNQQAMFYTLPPNEQQSTTIGQTYIQQPTQYVQVQTQPQQQIFIQNESVQPMVQMQYQ